MKKNSKLVYLLFICFFPLLVFAEDGMTVKIKCSPSNATYNDTVTCLITGGSNTLISSVEADINIQNSLTNISFTPSGSWTKDSTDGTNKIKVSSTDGVSGNSFEIGSLSLKVKEGATVGNSTITLSSIKFVTKDSEENNLVNTSDTININNNGAVKGLKKLSIVNGSLSTIFDTNKTSYSQIIVTSSNFKINATPVNDSDKVKVYNEDKQELDPSNITWKSTSGTMVVYIDVGTGDRLVTYTLVISHAKTNTFDNSLKSLTVGGKTVQIEKGKVEYNVKLDNVTSYEVNAVVSDPDNFILDSMNGVNGRWNDERTIIIVVTPIDDTSGAKSLNYKINVTGTNSSEPVNPKPSTPTTPTNPDRDITNPKTGVISGFVMLSILIISFIASIYLYRKNISGYNMK